MIHIDKILDEAIEKNASDIHLICGLKPMLRILRDLVEASADVLTEEDMAEIYDYFIRGNVDKDTIFNETRKLDMSYEYKNIRLRVNVSLTRDIPIFTLRIVKEELPPYESLRNT